MGTLKFLVDLSCPVQFCILKLSVLSLITKLFYVINDKLLKDVLTASRPGGWGTARRVTCGAAL